MSNFGGGWECGAYMYMNMSTLLLIRLRIRLYSVHYAEIVCK